MKKKIACFIPFPRNYNGFGGAERRISYIFSKLDVEKYDVTIIMITYQNKEKIKNEMARYVEGIKNVIYIKSNIKVYLHFLYNNYDIVCYTDCVLRTIPAIWGAIFGRSKRVMMMECVNNSSFNFKRNWYKYFYKLNIKLSNHIDCLYPSNVPRIISMFQNKAITVTPSILPRIENYLKLNDKQNIILFSGRLLEIKNPRLFIHSVVRVREELRKRNFKCWICGEGPLKEELITYVRKNGYEDFIEIKGYMDMEEVTPVCKVFCSLQNRDNYPSQSLLEAISCGCYCIASNRGDTFRIVKSDFGELVELDESSISSVILDVIKKTDEEWVEIENKAREFANNNFNVNNAVKHYDDIFGALLK